MSKNNLFVKTHIPRLDEIIPGFPRGGLILVSGMPGSGKTIFGMSYLYHGAVKGGESGLYVSLFEDRERFLQISNRLGLDFERLMDEGLVEHMWLTATLEAGVASVVNGIIERVKSLGARRLVIDSFTALKQSIKDLSEARILLQTIISRIFRELKCTTILIKEGETPAEGRLEFEEYVADAVINLKKKYLENRPLRILTIEKLRGAELPHPRTIYTIQNGIRVLTPFTPIKPWEIPRLRLPEGWPPPDSPEAYTTGIPDLDREIGGYPQGSTILLEIDPKLTPLEYSMIFLPTVVSFIFKGRKWMILPSSGVSPNLIESMLKPYGIDKQKFIESSRIFYEKYVPIEKPPNIMEIEPEPAETAGRKIIEFALELMAKTGKPPIMVIGVDRVVRLGGEEAISQLAVGQDCVRAYGELMIWLLKPTRPWVVERLAPIADIHLKVTKLHGCMLLYGVKPRTPLYAVQLDPERKILIPNLIPIV